MPKKINKKTKIVFLVIVASLFIITGGIFLTADFDKTEDIPSANLTLNSFSPNGPTGGVMVPACCELGYTGHECCPNNCGASICTYQTCWNGCATVSGSVCCPNSCQNSTCSTDPCWNGCSWVQGIVDCSCPLPWGGRIANKTSVTAYADSVVPCGSSCSPQTRTCTGGVLSGSYVNPGCWVQPCAAVSLSASQMTIGPLVASNTNLTWTTNANTVGCWGWSSNGDSLWDGGRAAGGGTITVSPSATATYNIVCWNAWGTNTSPASVTICVHTCGCESATCNYATCQDNCNVTCQGIVPDHTCGPWSDCSQDCGSGGTQTRTCVCPNKTDTQACNSQPCPPSYREVTPW